MPEKLPQDCMLHTAQLANIEIMVRRIDTTIHGNGNPGLKTLVAQHSQSLAVFKRLIWGIGALLGTLATGLILASVT